MLVCDVWSNFIWHVVNWGSSNLWGLYIFAPCPPPLNLCSELDDVDNGPRKRLYYISSGGRPQRGDEDVTLHGNHQLAVCMA